MATARNTKPAADEPKATYKVISPLSHDNALYEVGEPVELTEREAADLLGHTVEPVKARAAKD